MADLALQFQQLSKSYGDSLILSRLELEIYKGEFLGIVGVNGAGKTTLIKCLLDFSSVTSGTIRIFGREHNNTNARDRLAYLPEKFLPPYYLTGGDFLRYMGELYGNRFAMEDIRDMLRILDLDISSLGKSAGQLSRGMAQKLGLAACLLSRKELIIMDEPMSGLDPKARACLKAHLLTLKQKQHTFFFSTHLLSDVEKLCDRVAILHEGKIQYIGSPGDCCRHFDAADFEQAYLRCVGASLHHGSADFSSASGT